MYSSGINWQGLSTVICSAVVHYEQHLASMGVTIFLHDNRSGRSRLFETFGLEVFVYVQLIFFTCINKSGIWSILFIVCGSKEFSKSTSVVHNPPRAKSSLLQSATNLHMQEDQSVMNLHLHPAKCSKDRTSKLN
jgi:hypothetical protein